MADFLKEKKSLNYWCQIYMRVSWYYISMKVQINRFVYKCLNYRQLSFYNNIIGTVIIG